MNIFALHQNPAIAASMHCNAHIHKMILESAQMLCTVAGGYGLYTATHKNHPCTHWVTKTKGNASWVLQLCEALDDIRMSLGSDSHKSLEIARAAMLFIENDEMTLTPHIFCGPDQFRLRPDLSIHQKYQAYYKQKYRLWLDTAHPMSYKGRPLPGFLAEFADTIPHNGTILPDPM